jgi:hypothetical protein
MQLREQKNQEAELARLNISLSQPRLLLHNQSAGDLHNANIWAQDQAQDIEMLLLEGGDPADYAQDAGAAGVPRGHAGIERFAPGDHRDPNSYFTATSTS